MSAGDWGDFADQQEKDILKLTGELSISKLQNTDSNNVTANEEVSASQAEEPDITSAEASLMKKILRTKLVTSKADIEVQRADPNSPLYSVKSFNELNLPPNLLKGVFGMGFNSPSKIQETALPILLADPPQNLIAQSQSGTGKTAAFVISSLSRIDSNCNYPQVLILSPTFELAQQTGGVAKQMGKYLPEIKFCFALKGQEFSRGHKITDHCIIGTPGKVLDWGSRFRFFDLKKIKVFILDEADVMISMQGHQDQSIRIHKHLSKDCQMMLFSATYSDDVFEFAERVIPSPITIKLERSEQSLDNIKQWYIVCKSKDEKFQALSNIYGVVSIGQTIIFCHTKVTAAWLAEKMTDDGHAVGMLSGELHVDQRVAVLDRFRQGIEKVLITTNVCARGIDVDQVTVVVNFDMPIDTKGRADCETYLHRIGRTGRFGKKGLAINMVDGRNSMAVLKDIERHFGRSIEKIDANDINDLERLSNQ